MNQTETELARRVQAELRTPTSLTRRVGTYGPFLATAIILAAQAFGATFFGNIPVAASVASIAASFVLLSLLLESEMLTSRRRSDMLEASVAEKIDGLEMNLQLLVQVQSEMINSNSFFEMTNLGDAFAKVVKDSSDFSHLRIFAISSQQIMSLVRTHGIHVDTCDLLIQGTPTSVSSRRAFGAQIALIVADWRSMERDGLIGKLTILNYDFHPTQYECILDDRFLIFGLFDSDQKDYSKVRVRDPFLVRHSNALGSAMIAEFSQRFDNLFEECKSNHGKNLYADNP